MKIQIATRLRPFSHSPGSSCVIPGSFLIVRAFPTLLEIGPEKIFLQKTGPVRGFTLQQDLEKNCVFVFGRAKEGYFRIRIWAEDGRVIVLHEKGGQGRVEIETSLGFSSASFCERLSFGSHKAQDWDLVQRREDLKEILPFLFYLGQKVPFVSPQPLEGTASLLNFPKDRNKVEEALFKWVKASFKSLLVPRLVDDEHQGLLEENEHVTGNPFFLLQEGFQNIRSLFFEQTERRLSFLSSLPPSFDAGRMTNIVAEGIGKISFEWSKKRLKKILIEEALDGEILLDLPTPEKSFRVNRSQRQQKEEPLLLKGKKTYYLDRFEK